MGKQITALVVQERKPQRVNVYLDGEFAFGLSRITAAWLSVGRKLTDREIGKLLTEDEVEVAYQRALHYLSFRPRSKPEVIQNLKNKGFSDSIIETTLERMEEQNFVDDRSFADQWIENRNTFHPRSRRLLSAELRQKGITDQTIQNALEDVSIPEEELAYKAAFSRAQRYRSLDWIAFKTKVGAFLARRGFSYSVSTPVLKRLWEDTGLSTKSNYDEFINGVDEK
jgi:regulatory protein